MTPTPLEFVQSKFPGEFTEPDASNQFSLEEVLIMLEEYKNLQAINKTAKEWLQESHPAEFAALEGKQMRGQVTKYMEDYALSIITS